LFQIQILENKNYIGKGFQQGQHRESLEASRGNIYDRNNVLLTRNISHITLCGNPSDIIEKQTVAQLLSQCTEKPHEFYLNKLTSRDSFIFLERNILESECDGISKIEDYGVIIKKNYFRYYPFGSSGSQVIGFTDPDNRGLSGIEKQFDPVLTGTPGWILKKRSGTGKSKPDNSYPFVDPLNGSNIQLTLDIEYQCILEDELTKQLNDTNAKGATGVLMNPETGEVLAMASIPCFDPNHTGDYPLEYQKIKAITDQFEPGSTFKIVSATAALDRNMVSVDDEFFCENGSFFYNGVKIRDHEKYGLLTFSQVIEQSSNVGIIKITELLQVQPFYQYIKKFGFGIATDINLPGESKGFIREPQNWSKISPGVISMGQEISVTALQLASAYSAIANGGYLLRPEIVRQIMSHDGQINKINNSKVLRRVATIETMETLKKILVKTIKMGTGSSAAIPGWNLAGKTGTAEKFINGSYSETKFISNFVGFFPADKPKLLGVIIIDEPKFGNHWGSMGAAPVFQKVAKRIINMDDSFQPENEPEEHIHNNKLWASNKNGFSENSNNPILFNHPVKVENKECTVPDVRQMSLRKAGRKLKESGFTYSVHGSGIVSWQSPKPNEIKSCGSTCVIGLK
jgi:cell division protein FtsI/penicillin-binding protein 2